jgi:ABC-type lipoprotein export system ATPase subunit
MTNDTTAFSVSGLAKHYTLQGHRIDVLNGIDLEVKRGDWIALMGPSGSGKTTLLHLLAALDKPSAGNIVCMGADFARISGRRRTLLRRDVIGLLFQNYHLFPELTSVENAVLPALRWDINRGKAVSRARELLTQFDLKERFGHRPRELSGGEQQRVALARALINDPDIILADEPTGNLDQAAGAHIMDILADLHGQKGKTIIMVTHDRAVAERADCILNLCKGSLELSSH